MQTHQERRRSSTSTKVYRQTAATVTAINVLIGLAAYLGFRQVSSHEYYDLTSAKTELESAKKDIVSKEAALAASATKLAEVVAAKEALEKENQRLKGRVVELKGIAQSLYADSQLHPTAARTPPKQCDVEIQQATAAMQAENALAASNQEALQRQVQAISDDRDRTFAIYTACAKPPAALSTSAFRRFDMVIYYGSTRKEDAIVANNKLDKHFANIRLKPCSSSNCKKGHVEHPRGTSAKLGIQVATFLEESGFDDFEHAQIESSDYEEDFRIDLL